MIRFKVLEDKVRMKVSEAATVEVEADPSKYPYYVPEVTDGVLSFTPTRSDMPEVAPQNVIGPAGPQGPKGDTGPTGPQGPAGADGYTPQRGVDYWTAADQSQMVRDVLAALPVYAGEVSNV